MSERPIIFSTPMVKAILAGRKTQTRRIVKPAGPLQRECWDHCIVRWSETGHGGPGWYVWDDGCEDEGSHVVPCPYGQPGDVLWVRETWALPPNFDPERHGRIKDGPPSIGPVCFKSRYSSWDPWPATRWRPSIHMPRWAARLFLRVEEVRVERLQEISEGNARAEGVKAVSMADVPRQATYTDRQDFAQLWDQINGKRAPWESNPFVWVITFSPMMRERQEREDENAQDQGE